jgi:hypothetical protein
MKKEYFIITNGEKKGAYTFEELIKLDIYDDSKVWKAGWQDWKKVTEVDELKDYIILKPPLTENEIKQQKLYNNLIKYLFIFKSTYKRFLIISITVSLCWNFIYFLMAKDGGSEMYPIYLTRDERENPSLIFWNMLPSNLIFISSILLLMYLAYIFVYSKKI